MTTTQPMGGYLDRSGGQPESFGHPGVGDRLARAEERGQEPTRSLPPWRPRPSRRGSVHGPGRARSEPTGARRSDRPSARGTAHGHNDPRHRGSRSRGVPARHPASRPARGPVDWRGNGCSRRGGTSENGPWPGRPTPAGRGPARRQRYSESCRCLLGQVAAATHKGVEGVPTGRAEFVTRPPEVRGITTAGGPDEAPSGRRETVFTLRSRPGTEHGRDLRDRARCRHPETERRIESNEFR